MPAAVAIVFGTRVPAQTTGGWRALREFEVA